MCGSALFGGGKQSAPPPPPPVVAPPPPPTATESGKSPTDRDKLRRQAGFASTVKSSLTPSLKSKNAVGSEKLGI